MMTHEEALLKAIEALEHIKQDQKVVPTFGLIAALKEAQPREWVGLTEGEQVLLARDYRDTPLTLIYAVGNMLKEKNGA
jgi:hypothetical protein